MNNNFAVSMDTDNAQKSNNGYTKYDTAAALTLFPIAFAFVHFSGAADYPLGRLIFAAVLFFLSLFYFRKNGIKPRANPFAFGWGITMLLLNVGLIFTSNEEVQFVISAITLFGYLYFVFAFAGNSSEKHPSDLFFLEMVKAVLIMPFGSIARYFEAISNTKNGRKIGKTLILIIAGLAIAFIPAIIVFALLSYDESFKELVKKLFDLGHFDLFSLVSDLILAFPVAVLIFGSLYSCRKHSFGDILNAEKCRKTANAVRFAPIAMVCSAVFPFILIYSVFFISQIDYYLSAFSGILPEGLTYADYAKNGFFQLCAVSLVNAVIILCVSVFCRRKEEKAHLILRIVNIIFSVLTLILIATAISKMVLYIGTYGLTVKRVLSSAFMIFLSIVFIAIIIKQFLKKTNAIIITVISALLICATLAFSDVNGMIASYNTDRYLEGSLENFEPESLLELGESGIIYLDRIAEASNDYKVRALAEYFLNMEAESREKNTSVFSMTIPRLRAREVFKKYK